MTHHRKVADHATCQLHHLGSIVHERGFTISPKYIGSHHLIHWATGQSRDRGLLVIQLGLLCRHHFADRTDFAPLFLPALGRYGEGRPLCRLLTKPGTSHHAAALKGFLDAPPTLVRNTPSSILGLSQLTIPVTIVAAGCCFGAGVDVTTFAMR